MSDASDASLEDAADLLAARYREPTRPTPAHWSAVLDTMLSHRSVRGFLPSTVPAATLDLVLAAASSAPTSSNLQTWSVVVVEDPARKARLARLAAGQKFIEQSPTLLVWLADLARLEALAAARQQTVEGIHYLELLLVAVIDAALAAQNAVVALESLGLGSVYVGAMRNDPLGVAAELGLPKRVFPVFGLSIGFPDPSISTGIKPRLPPAAVVHREQYSAAAQPRAIAEYDARMSAFQAEQKMGPEIWTEKVINRVRTPASLSGRDRMREVLAKLGFELR
ncbi:MAG: NADPH-dependent oxidoreductase [Rhodospirillales bacterium 70-18]|nr:MAG: NADPH-dependent oxidoreductase [Rhodospirillales bacterium 70-18]